MKTLYLLSFSICSYSWYSKIIYKLESLSYHALTRSMLKLIYFKCFFNPRTLFYVYNFRNNVFANEHKNK